MLQHTIPVVGVTLPRRSVTAVPSPRGVPSCGRAGAVESPPRHHLPPTRTCCEGVGSCSTRTPQ